MQISQSIHPTIERRIDSLFVEYNSQTAGVAVAIVQDGKTIYSKVSAFAFEMEFQRSGKKVVGFEISNFGAKKVKFTKK